MSINLKDLYWLAGWLEGEGSFTIHSAKDKPNYKQFRIEYSSTDLDIILKVNKLLKNPNRIYKRARTLTMNGTMRKQEYYAKIYNNLAIQWMMTLYSLMGNRRKNKIKEIIIVWKEYIQNNSGKCRTCKSELIIKFIKSGWNKGKKQTYCNLCRRNKKIA